ncbi:MAG: L,D-transpeptidase family protein [Candidatus Omnitrophota bacterium]
MARVWYLIVFLFVIALSGTPVQAAEPKIPDCLLGFRFGPEQHVLIVDKASQMLYVYSNYNEKPIASFKITTGKKPGPKAKEGDMKTPEGIYFFTRVLFGNALPKIEDYGERAFVLNYPNPIDKLNKKNGDGIWLHGANDQRKTTIAFNSRGCVVLSNDDLAEVSRYISLRQTPVCIYERIRYDTVSNIQKKRDQFIACINDWKNNWENKNIDDYIKYYDKSFSYNSLSLAQFKKVKENLNQRYKFIRVFLSDTDLYYFKGYYMALFNQLYISDQTDFYSKKIQYWKEDLKIDKLVDEDSLALPPPAKFEFAKGNLLSIDEYRKNIAGPTRIEPPAVTSVPASTPTPTIPTPSLAGAISPVNVHVSTISIMDQSVKLVIQRSANAKAMRVIPVARFENRDRGTLMQSLDGIVLKGGVPQDYSRAINLEKNEIYLSIKKDKDDILKSLTVFLVNLQNDPEQILTYLMN